jgi:hypothetical protein
MAVEGWMHPRFAPARLTSIANHRLAMSMAAQSGRHADRETPEIVCIVVVNPFFQGRPSRDGAVARETGWKIGAIPYSGSDVDASATSSSKIRPLRSVTEFSAVR